jgi:hypothetical protein
MVPPIDSTLGLPDTFREEALMLTLASDLAERVLRHEDAPYTVTIQAFGETATITYTETPAETPAV